MLKCYNAVRKLSNETKRECEVDERKLRNEYKNGLNEVWGNLRLFEDKGKKGKKGKK